MDLSLIAARGVGCVRGSLCVLTERRAGARFRRCRKECTCKECLRCQEDLHIIKEKFDGLDAAKQKQYAKEVLTHPEVMDELRKFVQMQVAAPRAPTPPPAPACVQRCGKLRIDRDSGGR
jgi:hypothetical protein